MYTTTFFFFFQAEDGIRDADVTGVQTCALPISKEDLEQGDIYPFAALSAGLCRDRKYRKYGVEHFAHIAHRELKLFWAAALFGAQPPLSTEIVEYLRAALESKERSQELREIVGPGFESFKERGIQTPPSDK